MLSEESKKNVLVVDDDEAVLESVRILLQLGGIKATTVAKAEDAVEELENAVYDLLILDVGMPGMDGIGLFELLENSDAHRDVPVLFMSGFPMWAEADKQKREVFNRAGGYLQKPFDVGVFMRTVHRLMKKQAPALDRPEV